MNRRFKKYLTATNCLIVALIVFYLLDCYLPLPQGYEGYTAWNNDAPPALNYIFGFCGGLLTNHMAMGQTLAGGTAVYRHITQMLLHGGLLHLTANAVGLYFIGNYTEKRFGWWLTLVLFFLVGFIESFITDPLYLAIAPRKAEEVAQTVSMGASGGVFGLAGASLAALLFDIKSFKKIDKPTLIVSAIYGVVATYVVSFGWTTVCHNVALVLGLAIGTAVILPFYVLKKGKFAPGIKIPVGRKVHVIIDRKMGTVHPNHENIFYEVNYGYVENVTGGDGEEQDVYVLGVDEPVDTFDGVVTAVIHRLDDNEDKWVVVPEGIEVTDEEIVKKTHFQERYFKTTIER